MTNGTIYFQYLQRNETEAIDYGVLTAENGLLVEMLRNTLKQYLVSMGIYAVNKKVVTFILKMNILVLII